MSDFDKLSEIFRQFPGIGPRQAQRFAYFVLRKNSGYIADLIKTIQNARQSVAICDTCFRFFMSPTGSATCPICQDPNRDQGTFMVVPNDIDLENIEKTNVFNGLYFVLGGTLKLSENEAEKKIRIENLKKKIKESSELKEVIVAMSLNPEGEHTAEYVISEIKPLADERNISVSTLGRGLSTGVELEYSDDSTLKNALENRHAE